jgi:DNA-binding HxlR family transcriptional regulator
MRTYEQYCPIARAAEIFAERWTPLIVRNIHAGCGTYSEILDGAPGLSHTLLTQRLRQLNDLGIISVRPKVSGRGVRYELTDAGHDLWPVLLSLGAWGEQWVELRDEHTNPRFLLWTWCTTYLAHDNLPDRRVVVRFELLDRSPEERRIWLIVNPAGAEVCRKRPRFHDNLVVETTAMALVQWHTKQIEWADAVRAGKVRVTGPRALAKALPTWNRRSSSPWKGDARPSIARPARRQPSARRFKEMVR